jgi:hypothetical protein
VTLDHLIVAGPDLAALVMALRQHTGVAAAPGGRHLGHGTHNALAGLGEGRYLELLAPDPDQAGGTFAAALAGYRAPTLHTWCARAGEAAAVAERVRAAGCVPRRLAMQRRRPDGSVLAWELVFVDGHPFADLVPFFIDWLGTPHPSASLAGGLRVRALTLAHPDADGLVGLLRRLGGLPAPVDVVAAPHPARHATLVCGSRRWRVVGPTT